MQYSLIKLLSPKLAVVALVLSLAVGGSVSAQTTPGDINMTRNLLLANAPGFIPSSTAEIMEYRQSADVALTDSSVVDATNADELSGDLMDIDDNGLGVVDWVEVQLRVVAQGGDAPGGPNPTPMALGLTEEAGTLAHAAGLLLSDGRVVDGQNLHLWLDDIGNEDNDNSVLSFEGFSVDDATQDLYVVVQHRNHVAIMSAASVDADSSGVYEYDFTDSSDKAFNGAFGVISPANALGNWCMALGDVNSSGAPDGTDRNLIGAAFGLAAGQGYVNEDVNLSGSTDGTDVNLMLANFGLRAQQINYYNPTN